MQRRQVLRTSAATLGAAVGLAGCLSGSSDDQRTRRADTERPNDRDDDMEADAVETTPDDREETETPADLTAPPRESAVFAAVEASEARLRVTFESTPVVESLAESGGTTAAADATRTATNRTATATITANETASADRTTDSDSLGRLADSLAVLSPVGAAAGSPGRGGGGRGGRGGGGSGSGGGRNGGSGSGSGGSGWGGSGSGGSGGKRSGSGRSGGSKSGTGGSSGGSSKPSPGKRGSGDSPSRGRNGRHKWRGGSYAAWHDRHEHRVRDRNARVVQCGVGYLGDPDATDEDLPGAGPVEWTHRCDGDHDEMAVEPSDPGWYRVGARLRGADSDRDFGWEAVDVKLLDGDDGLRIDGQWKVSPRL